MPSSTKRRSLSPIKQAMGICVLIAIAIGLLTFIPHDSLFTRPAPQPSDSGTDIDRYSGEIRLDPTANGRCRVIAFDNRYERFWDKGLLPCDPEPSAQEQGGRLGSISKSFKRQ